MLEVLTGIGQLARIEGPLYLAIGVFDGVHLGHRAVIERAVHDARAGQGTPVVVTFDPHPLRVLRPEKAPRLLTSTAHKLRLIRQLGVRHLLVIPFTPEFAATPPADFIRELAAAGRPLREICVGHQWSFGKGRAGNLELLRQLGGELGFEEVGVPAVEMDGQIVSSTVIRQAVETGDLEKAARLLGREYTILGTVIRGRELGRTIGFPTANVSAHNEQFPPDGVYAVEADIEGRAFGGVANIGFRPTVEPGGSERRLEVHLFDFERDIYGAEVEVRFVRFLRPEQKFDGLPQLQAQIKEDADAARRILAQSRASVR